MVLRTAPKVKTKVDFTDKERVRRSPYYLCNNFWDKLESTVQKSNTIFEFTRFLGYLNVRDL